MLESQRLDRDKRQEHQRSHPDGPAYEKKHTRPTLSTNLVLSGSSS